MTRSLFKILMSASVLIALTVAVVCSQKLGWTDPVAWATVAAVLAVLAAIASAWTSERVLEMQEDAQLPNPVPILDLRSRYQMAQFRITNHGGAPAHNVKIIWARQLLDAEGKDVVLGRDIPIPVIPQSESASVELGLNFAFIRAHPDTTFSGTVTFSNSSGRQFSTKFLVSAEHERYALLHDNEGTKMQFELQKVPDLLARIADEVAKLRR